MSNNGNYSVGYTDEGETIINITYNGVRTTLTLNEYGVRKFIKLLEATLDGDDTNDTEE